MYAQYSASWFRMTFICVRQFPTGLDGRSTSTPKGPPTLMPVICAFGDLCKNDEVASSALCKMSSSIPGTADTSADTQPSSKASSAMLERRAVLPVPRAPMRIVERLGSPGPLANASRMEEKTSSRPAKYGGTLPNVGVNGLRTLPVMSPSPPPPAWPSLPFAFFANFCILCKKAHQRECPLRSLREMSKRV